MSMILETPTTSRPAAKPRPEWPPLTYDTLQAALGNAQAGYRIFPCNPRTKAPLLRVNADSGWKEPLVSSVPTSHDRPSHRQEHKCFRS